MHLVMLPVKTGLKQGKLMPRSHHASVKRCNISTLNLHKLLPQHCVSQLKQDAMLKQRGKQSQNSLAVLWRSCSKRMFPKMHKGEFGICGVSSWKLLRGVEKPWSTPFSGLKRPSLWLCQAVPAKKLGSQKRWHLIWAYLLSKFSGSNVPFAARALRDSGLYDLTTAIKGVGVCMGLPRGNARALQRPPPQVTHLD